MCIVHVHHEQYHFLKSRLYYMHLKYFTLQYIRHTLIYREIKHNMRIVVIFYILNGVKIKII